MSNVSRLANCNNIIVLTGAGISAESGIPTFRGENGYWTVGSSVYQPEEMATKQAFEAMPKEVWHWYLYRRTVCLSAQPNRAHGIIGEWSRQKRVALVTQNVDGLHERGGALGFEIHGNINKMRNLTTKEISTIPKEVGIVEKDVPLTEAQWSLVADSRPHILWFDESYNEEHYHFDTVIELARDCDALVTVGTTAMTTLPNVVMELARDNDALLIDININPNPFSDIAVSDGGVWLQHAATKGIAALANVI